MKTKKLSPKPALTVEISSFLKISENMQKMESSKAENRNATIGGPSLSVCSEDICTQKKLQKVGEHLNQPNPGNTKLRCPFSFLICETNSK
jgi:hypothetical protein